MQNIVRKFSPKFFSLFISFQHIEFKNIVARSILFLDLEVPHAKLPHSVCSYGISFGTEEFPNFQDKTISFCVIISLSHLKEGS